MAAEHEYYIKRGSGRVWLQRYGAGPSHAPEYLGCGRMGAFSKDEGEPTPMWCPSSSNYGKYVAVDTLPGEEGLPTTSVEARMALYNPLLEFNCPLGVQAHWGDCEDPLDFDGGWKLAMLYLKAQISTKGLSDQTAMEPGDEESVMSSGDLTALDWMLAKQLVLEELAGDVVLQEAVDIVNCDRPSCGECGIESDGCQIYYGIAKGSGAGSPGWPAEVFWTLDGGTSWYDEDITTLASDEDPIALDCVGDKVVVVSNDSCSLHYAYKVDMTVWAEVTSGFIPGGCPNAIFSVTPTKTWIVGDGGYIYFTDDPTSAVEVQDCAATGEDLLAVHFINTREGVAVGENNAVVHTENGGRTWETITGPEALAALLCVWMRSSYVWMVGTDTGHLYYTLDKGTTWTAKSFPGSTLGGEVRDIAFSRWEDSPVGFMAWYPDGVTATDGRLLRSINGGFSWYVLPEGRGSMPDNHGLSALAVCPDPNTVLAVGLATDDEDGFVVKGSA